MGKKRIIKSSMPNVDLRLAFSSLLKPQKNLHKLFLIEKTEDDDDDDNNNITLFTRENLHLGNSTNNKNNNNNNADDKLFAINLLETLKSAAIKGLALVKKSFSKNKQSSEIGHYCKFE